MSVIPQDFLAVRAYHKATKHRLNGYAPSPGFLDWDSQPNPFRCFAGCVRIGLPLVCSGPEISFAQLFGQSVAPQDWTVNHLSLALELSAGISAWKSDGVGQWALRNNPSSGNLHPTEWYLIVLQSPKGKIIPPGVYHYLPREHALEMRAQLKPGDAIRLAELAGGARAMICLSSVIWREEWKYGARALRYCHHDLGHAIATSRFATRVMGWRLELDCHVGDQSLQSALGLDRTADFEGAEREHADAALLLYTNASATDGDGQRPVQVPVAFWQQLYAALGDWQGKANRLSSESIRWPQIHAVLEFLQKPEIEVIGTGPGNGWPALPAALAQHQRPATRIIRNRRSAQRMSGQAQLTLAQFEALMACTLPNADAPPFDCWPLPPAIQLLVYVHSVAELTPGLYTLSRNPHLGDALQSASTNKHYVWEKVAATELPLYRLEAPLHLAKLAAQLHCYQGIAGKSAVCIDMIGDLGGAMKTFGAWAYRTLHWEAGMIGQALYLQAEAMGFRGTGIGCFFDDEIHALLGLEAEGAWQMLYGFTVGEALDDHRITSLPAYHQQALDSSLT